MEAAAAAGGSGGFCCIANTALAAAYMHHCECSETLCDSLLQTALMCVVMQVMIAWGWD